MQDGDSTVTGLGRALRSSKPAQVGEIVAVFVVALVVIVLAAPPTISHCLGGKT